MGFHKKRTIILLQIIGFTDATGHSIQNIITLGMGHFGTHSVFNLIYNTLILVLGSITGSGPSLWRLELEWPGLQDFHFEGPGINMSALGDCVSRSKSPAPTHLVPNTCGPPQLVPNWLVPLDKWSSTNSVPMDKWSPKIGSPLKNGPQPIWAPWINGP